MVAVLISENGTLLVAAVIKYDVEKYSENIHFS
jgi:hypothetical protein